MEHVIETEATEKLTVIDGEGPQTRRKRLAITAATIVGAVIGVALIAKLTSSDEDTDNSVADVED